MKAFLSQKTVNYAAGNISLGGGKSPLPCTVRFVHKGQRLPATAFRPAPRPARGAEGRGGLLADRLRMRNGVGGDAAECAARAPKGGGCAGGGKYGVAFGNTDLPQSRGRGAKLPVCSKRRSEALGGNWGKRRVCSAAGEKGWKGVSRLAGEGRKQTRTATTAERGP